MRRLFMLLLFIVFLAGSAHGSMFIDSNVHSSGMGASVDGSILWQISGAEALTLRNYLAENYDENHDGTIQISEASNYMRNLTATLVHRILGHARINQAVPYHDWVNELVNPEDVQGICGPLNDSKTISIHVKFSGMEVEDGYMDSMVLAQIPFATAANCNLSRIFVPNDDVKVQHTEMLFSLIPYGEFHDSVIIRAVLGTYFYYRGPAVSEPMHRSSVPIIYSPLVLFLILVVSENVARLLIHRSNRFKGFKNANTFRCQNMNFYIRLGVIALYFPSQLIIHFPGWLFILACVMYPPLVYYCMLRCAVRSADLFHVEFLFLFKRTGEEILHKDFVDGDSSIIAGVISEFIRRSEFNEHFEYGEYHILIQEGDCVYIAVAGKGSDYGETKKTLVSVIEKIERKCKNCEGCSYESLNNEIIGYLVNTKFN